VPPSLSLGAELSEILFSAHKGNNCKVHLGRPIFVHTRLYVLPGCGSRAELVVPVPHPLTLPSNQFAATGCS
jgi:hypothetical protein